MDGDEEVKKEEVTEEAAGTTEETKTEGGDADAE